MWPAAAMRRASCAKPAVASRILSCLSDLALPDLPDFPMALIKTSCCSAAPPRPSPHAQEETRHKSQVQ